MAVDSQQPCQDPPRAAAEFTVAVRTQRKSIAKPVKPSTVRLPEVRFSRNAALPRTGGNSELHTSTVSSFAVSPPETRVHPPSAYPYWLVALVQIILGTLLVILLVKFTQLIKDSSQSPSQSRASVAPDAGPWQPRISLLGKADQPSHPALPDPWGL
jgi:hypothetical protein